MSPSDQILAQTLDVKSQPIVNITLNNVEPIKVAAIKSNMIPTDTVVLAVCMMTV